MSQKLDNPFEKSGWDFTYKKKVAKEYHGEDVMVHLGLMSPEHESQLDFVLAHELEFEIWCSQHNREPKLVLCETLGVYWFSDGIRPMDDGNVFMISLPKKDEN